MRYRAFISYASADRVAGERFQRAIEHYRIPTPLRGQDRGFGVVPTHLTPLFRDRSDANAGDLDEVLMAALRDSDALVVLCSPASARSEWVNREIHSFRAMHESARVLPVVLSGQPRRFDPATAPEGAFPPALFQRLDKSGQVIAEDAPVPLAADVQPSGDGPDLAKLKIIAGLTGIPLVELTDRQREAERYERRVVRTVVTAIVALAVVATAAAVRAYYSTDKARTRLANQIEMVARRVDDAERFKTAYGVPMDVVRELLKGAEKEAQDLVDTGDTGVPVLELERARLHVEFSKLYEVAGDARHQLEQAQQARDAVAHIPLTRKLSAPTTWFAALPDPKEFLEVQLSAIEAWTAALSDEDGRAAEITAALEEGRVLAAQAGRNDFVSRFWSLIGDRQYATGDVKRAEASDAESWKALDTYLASGTTESASIDRARALSDRAELFLETERHKEALVDQSAAVQAFETYVNAHPTDSAARQSLADTLIRHGDNLKTVTNCWTDSIPEFDRAIKVLDDLRGRDPGRIDYDYDVSVALDHLGDAMLQTGDLVQARVLFDRVTDLRHGLVRRIPESQPFKRVLASALERQSDVAMGEHNPQAALAAIEEARGLLIEPRPGTGDEQNLVRARDLAIEWFKTGAARQAAKSSPSWREAYQKAIDLIEPFVKKGVAPDGWFRDLTVFHSGYGDALLRDGRMAEAREQWSSARSYTVKQRAGHADDPRLKADLADLDTRLKTGKIPPDRPNAPCTPAG